MKTLYESIWQYLETNQSTLKDGWNPKTLLMKYFEDYIGQSQNQQNTNLSVNFTNIEDLIYGEAIARMHYKSFFSTQYGDVTGNEGKVDFNWSTEGIGTFFVNLLHKKDVYSIGKYYIQCGGKNGHETSRRSNQAQYEVLKSGLKQLQQAFTIQGQNLSLPGIAYLHSVVDFKTLDLESMTKDNQVIFETLLDQEFYQCINDTLKRNAATDLNSLKDIIGFQLTNQSTKEAAILPCQEANVPTSCLKYCQWHKSYFDQVPRDEFLTIMRYSKPQRKIVDNGSKYEKKLFNHLFPEHKSQSLKYQVAPRAVAVYCQSQSGNIEGDEIGLGLKVCDEFFPTPTHNGMCMTSKLNINSVLKFSQDYNPIFEPDNQKGVEKSEEGNLRQDMTLLFVMDNSQHFRKSFSTKVGTNFDKLKLQIHQPKELANMVTDTNYLSGYHSFILQAGNEYFIEVSPKGAKSSPAFKRIAKEHRNCLLDDEVNSQSAFKVYTLNNCKYECHVSLASSLCKCIPWEFIQKSQMEECDIFGRTCFFNALSNYSTYPTNMCKMCKQECDFVKYSKEITHQEPLFKFGFDSSLKGKYATFDDTKPVCMGSEAICNLLLDKNNTLMEKGFLEAYKNFGFPADSWQRRQALVYKDIIIVHLRIMPPEMDLHDVKYTILDKFANFGGNYGIFAEITGCSFLPLLNFFIILFKLLTSHGRN